jgi:hypothetical protein
MFAKLFKKNTFKNFPPPFICIKKNMNMNFKKKKIKSGFKNKLLSFRDNNIKIRFCSLFNIVEFEKVFKTVFNNLAACLRNIVSIYCIKKTNIFISYDSYIFSSDMFLPTLYLSSNWMSFVDCSLENVEQIRNNFINRIITIINQNCLYKTNVSNLNNQNYYPRILVIVPTQTILIQMIRILFDKVSFKKYKTIAITKFIFKNSDFLKIKNGKIIYPADKRTYSSDGQKDLFELGVKINKNSLIFKSNIEYTDIAFLTPLKICKFSKKKSSLLFSKLRICFVDDLSKLGMLNFEILLNILKKIMLSNRKNISLLEKKFKNLKNFFFQAFLFSNLIFKDNLSVLDNLSKNNFFLFYKLPKKRCFFAFGNYNYKIFKFRTNFHEKVIKKRYDFFISQIFLFLKIKINHCLLIFFRTYMEYILIRNFIWKFKETGKIEIIDFNEYIPNKNIDFNKIFFKNKRNITLLTERFYFFNRYIFKNFSKIIFYTLPLNWEFYFEICSLLYKVNTSNVYLIVHLSDIDYIQKILGLQKTQEIFQR